MSRKKKIPGEVRMPTKRHNWTFVSKHSIDEIKLLTETHGFRSIRIKNLISLIERDGLLCVKCGIEFTHFERTKEKNGTTHLDLFADDGTMLTIDHIIPVSKGGHKTDLNNMQLMCKVCNEIKSDKIEGVII